MVCASRFVDVSNEFYDRIGKSFQIWNCFVLKWANIMRTKGIEWKGSNKKEWANEGRAEKFVCVCVFALWNLNPHQWNMVYTT